MTRYDPRTPRTLFACAAAALTIATLALAVAAPSSISYGTKEIGVVTQANALPARAAGDVTRTIEVVVVRATRVVPVMHSRASEMKAGLSS